MRYKLVSNKQPIGRYKKSKNNIFSKLRSKFNMWKIRKKERF